MLDLIIEGLTFAEGIRWHEGALWFSDFHSRTVYRVGDDSSEAVVTLDDDTPSGLGWLPDGSLIIVAMKRRRLLRFDGKELSVHAELSNLIAADANDLYVDSDGKCYVTHFGSHVVSERMPDGRFRIIQPPVPAAIILADKGQAREASVAELSFPNGIALRPDGTMVVAETVGRRLSIFDRATDGSLTNRRTLAEVDGCPDGIAVDAEGSIWFADPERCGCYRIDPDGREAEHIPTGQACFTCALGGPDGRTLYMVLGERLLAEEALRKRPGHVVATQIAVPAFV